MRQRRLGERLRALIMATPLIGMTTCGNLPTCPSQTQLFLLVNPVDGGSLAVSAGGCGAACEVLLSASSYCSAPQFCEVDGGCFLLDSGTSVSCTFTKACGFGGRRPASLLASEALPGAHRVGACFAEAARLEAASVPAFRMLARELAAYGAPSRLVRFAQGSASDEVRHARSTGALAHRYGVEPIQPSFGPTPMERSLEVVATENAVEGCVRETYGALVALWQARHAQDPVVAAAMAPIAADETRHAELAWEIASWAESQLSRAARGRIDAARSQALDELAHGIAHPVAIPLVALAGLPNSEVAAALLSSLAADLESAG